MTEPFSPETTSALDRFVVPSLRADFADSVMRAASSGPSWSRSPAKRRWARHSFVSAVAFFSLAGAAAAAGGWFGEAVVKMPVIREIASVMPEAAKVRPKPAMKMPPKESNPQIVVSPKMPLETATAPPTAQVEERPALHETVDLPSIRREAAAERMQARMDARDKRRGALGLPGDSQPEREALSRFRTAETPEARQQAVADLRKLRHERRARMAAKRAELQEKRAKARGRACSDFPEEGWKPPRCRFSPAEVPDEPLPQ